MPHPKDSTGDPLGHKADAARPADAVDRREFIKRAGTAGAALVTQSVAADSQAPSQSPQPAPEQDAQADSHLFTEGLPGSDFMLDVLRTLNVDYICSNPGASFRALHESIVNYGGNSKPEFITCCHEESAVAMAHGYFKIEGKPLVVCAHGTVGLQHASMAIYNAYCDRVPVYVVLGNTADATMRHREMEWAHSVQDAAAMVRDYTKWDDTPATLQHFAESAVRAYKLAMTPPMGPVVLVADTELQEHAVPNPAALRIPKLTLATPPQGDMGAVTEVARLLVGASNPVLVPDRMARTPAGMALLIELAELLQAAVVIASQNNRQNFPSRHPLNQSMRARQAIADADVIVGLEVNNFFGVVNAFRDQAERTTRSVTKQGAKLINISAGDLSVKANYQNFQRYAELDLAISGDAEATLPLLIDAVKRLITASHRTTFAARGAKLAEASRAVRERAFADATYGWDASPISTARLAAEVWEQIKQEDWSLVCDAICLSQWPLTFWSFDKPYQAIGRAGAGGLGYYSSSSVGAALANRKHGRLSVHFQDDGDLLYGPSVLWTAAHHRIPVLSIMHNNRAYHEEVMHVQRIANRRNRGIDRAHIGNVIEDPFVDFAKLAQSLGVHGEGPISNPKDLAPALKRAIAIVKRGEPALIDVLTQPR